VNDEELFDAPVTKEIVKHFSSEKPKERDINELVRYAYEMKQQKEECEKEYKLSMDKIKSTWKLDKMEGRKKTVPVEGYDIIVTKRNGSVKFDYEKFIEDELGADAVGEIEQIKTLAKEGKADSKYIEVGEGSVAVEIVKREEPPAF